MYINNLLRKRGLKLYKNISNFCRFLLNFFIVRVFLVLNTRQPQISCQQNSKNYLRTFVGVETAALTFRTKKYSTSYSSHICYGKRFYNDFFLNHHTIALVSNCLKLLSCVVIETALDFMKKNQLS